jgi:hypothetical protein
MRNKLAKGMVVETVEPEEVSTDWAPDAILHRKWNVVGEVVGHSDSHGLIYQVRHADGTKGWYEPRELKIRDLMTHSPDERAVMLTKMKKLSDEYYANATHIGCHAFIEFAGLMNEFISVCTAAHKQGDDFPFANTHSGVVLPFQPHNLAYLAEKLGCIYGPALLASEENRRAFINALFDGEYKLVATASAPKKQS